MPWADASRLVCAVPGLCIYKPWRGFLRLRLQKPLKASRCKNNSSRSRLPKE
jgi:hypothetical protein